MKQKKAIIIGSGIAGLAAAIRLGVQGYEVNVFEANQYPGGKLSSFDEQGYFFDAGPSLFTQPANVEELFILANEPIEDYFKYTSSEIACRYFFENGKKITAYTQKEKFSEELSLQLGEHPQAAIKYLSAAEKLYRNVGMIFLNFSLHKTATWVHKRVWKAFSTIRYSNLFSTLNRHNQFNFQTPEAIQIFNRFATYNGSNPYKAPGMLSVIPHLEQNEGTFYPYGGMISITHALYNLALKKGVRFHFNQAVNKIIHSKGRVTGIASNDDVYEADVVISNADIFHTYKYLLQDLTVANKIEKIERSSSALIFYWGIEKEFQDLGLHNILFSKNYQEEFDCLFNKKIIHSDPTIYINITSKMEQGQAPEGAENWFVMINAPTNEGQDWPKIIAETRKNVIEKINRILKVDVESLIKVEKIMDPIEIEKKTNTFKGSLYGTSSNSLFSAFFRPANFTSKYKGLYFCGGTVHPGGGIPLCLKSAYIATELIKKDASK